jgi:hypothetical protein
MATPRYSSLYQLNTHVWLTELSQRLGRAVTLDDILDADLDRLAQMGFDWVWFLSVWQTGLAAQKVSRSNPAWCCSGAVSSCGLHTEARGPARRR